MLGTPPAFILSQDQTLLFNLWFRSTLVNLSRFYCLLGFVPSVLKTSGTVPLNNSFWNFQGCITVYLSRYFAGFFSPPALSGLRAFLSRNGDYLITCCFLSQALFYFFEESFSFDSSKGILDKPKFLLFFTGRPGNEDDSIIPVLLCQQQISLFYKNCQSSSHGPFQPYPNGCRTPCFFSSL